jgi:hypothetical protein
MRITNAIASAIAFGSMMKQRRDHRSRSLIENARTRARSTVNAIANAISMSPATRFAPPIAVAAPRLRDFGLHPIEGRSPLCIGGDRFLPLSIFVRDIRHLPGNLHAAS